MLHKSRKPRHKALDRFKTDHFSFRISTLLLLLGFAYVLTVWYGLSRNETHEGNDLLVAKRRSHAKLRHEQRVSATDIDDEPAHDLLHSDPRDVQFNVLPVAANDPDEDATAPLNHLFANVQDQWKQQPQELSTQDLPLSSRSRAERLAAFYEVYQRDRHARHAPLHNMDPHNRWRPPPYGSMLPSPFRSDIDGKFSGTVFVPERHRRVFGGLCADIGWLVSVGRHALYQSPYYGFEFPDYWGHGPHSWLDLFEPVTLLPVKQRVSLMQEFKEDRHAVKKKDVFINDHDNMDPFMTKYANLQPGSDINVMRYVFKWIFRPRIEIVHPLREMIKLPKRYIGMHIRRGDKVGMAAGPREGSFVAVDRYIQLLFQLPRENLPNVLFVATDDYTSVEELRERVGDYFDIYTNTKPENRGFSIKEYQHKADVTDKFRRTLDMWIDMECLANATYFIANFESNVARAVNLMRFDKPANTSIATYVRPSCEEDLLKRYQSNSYNNCA